MLGVELFLIVCSLSWELVSEHHLPWVLPATNRGERALPQLKPGRLTLNLPRLLEGWNAELTFSVVIVTL